MPRVIVVDDQAEKRAALVAALMSAGFDAAPSCSAEAAACALDGCQIAIVDLMLHGTNGFELARLLREHAPDVSVILTSDYHFSPTQLEKMNCGAIAFVPRPFALAELTEFLWAKLDARLDNESRPTASLS